MLLKQWTIDSDHPETCAAEPLNDLVFACTQTQMLHKGLIDCVCKALAELLLGLVPCSCEEVSTLRRVSLEVCTILPSALVLAPHSCSKNEGYGNLTVMKTTHLASKVAAACYDLNLSIEPSNQEFNQEDSTHPLPT